MGSTDMGYMVGLGCTSYFCINSVFLFVGYMVLFDSFDDPSKGARAAGILAMVGIVFVPIIKFSVDILELRTLHQGASVSKLSGSSVHSTMLWPLMTMATAYLSLIHI